MRAFRAVGGEPVFIQRGIGPYLYDVDGNRYVDFVGSWGPLVLGHADPEVLEAIVHTAASGTTFGAPTQREVELGEMVQFMMPSMEKMRLVSSGTEATMSALRVARGFTKRDKIVKIDGGYHGHSDSLLVAAGSGAVTLGIPGSAGVPGAPSPTRSSSRSTTSTPCARRSRRTRARSPRSSSSRSRPTWASCCRARPTCPCCARSATSTARC